jgi:hypothetical protein
MIWRLVAASVKGSSHAASNTPCQDSNWASPSEGDATGPVLCAFVADGAGSACCGGDGAEVAMSTAAQFMRERIRHAGFAPDEAVLLECMTEVRRQISHVAEAANLTPRDYACTFLGVVSAASRTALIQVGDGGIVVDFGEGLSLPIVPMSGEYANMTYFVTDEDAMARVQTKELPGVLHNLAVFTDGIQRLAINMATYTPHPPFFTRFFQVLSQSSLEDEDKLQDALLVFLSSEAVDAKTDDDRTLVLASLVGA